MIFIYLPFFAFVAYLIYYFYQNRWKTPKHPMNLDDIAILEDKVPFYQGLKEGDQIHFEFKVLEFLLNTRIEGVKTEVERTDELLIAASAIIPIFNFKKWRYDNLTEVLLYPSGFDGNFKFKNQGTRILGMVGSGFMEGKMILSKKALYHGFQNETDKHNTAIHEFVHLIDKADGNIDGIPAVFLEKQYILPWMTMVLSKISEIRKKEHKDINPYGATNQAEFFAVISTYFFEQPQLLKRKHPELYKILCEIFDH